MSTAVMMELCCQILAHQWFRRMLAWVHPRPMLECLRCTACSGLVGHPFSSRCRTRHYCSKRCRRVIGTLLVRRSAAGAVAAVQRAAELADVLRRELRAGARRHRQDRCTVLSDGDAISRWDFTNNDAILASYLGLAPAEGRTGGEGDQPATLEEGRLMEASRLTGGAQASPPAVSSEGGLQAEGSGGPHAGGPLPAALSDELPIQDRGGAFERRGHPPQIDQGFLLALAKIGLAVGVRPALQALRQQGFVTDSRQVRAGRLELRSRQAASAQTDPEGDGRKRDGSAGPKWTRAGPSVSLEELARRQGIQSSHCSYTSGAVPASSEVSTTSTSKWVEGQEEAFRLKLLLIYAKGRPRQTTLSEEETVAVHRWQQHLEAELQGLGTEIASAYTAKWGSVQEVVDDPVATAELHLTSLLTGWTIREVIYRYMMAVDRPEVVAGELNLQALLLWESDHYRSHPFWSRMEADHCSSASPSNATMHGRFITRLCSALGIEMDEVVPFAATERPAVFFLRMVSVVANDSLTPTISEQDRTGLSHIWRRRLAFAEYCRARHPDAKRLALYLDLAALRAARRVDEFTWVSDWIQQLMSGNFRPVTGLHREGNEGSRVTKEPWDGRRNECALSSAIFVLRQAMHSCDVKLASGAQSRLDKLLGIEEGEIYAPASPLDLKALRAEWEQESNKMLTTQSTPLFRQLHDALFRPKNVQGTEYDGIDVVSLLEQLMLPVLEDVVGRGGKFFGAQVRHEQYCGCCGERLGEGTDEWQRTLSLPKGQALSAAFTEIAEINREMFLHGPDHKPCRSTIQHSVQTVSAVGQVLVVFETPGQGGWPGRGSAETLMFLRSEGVALAQVAGITTALPDDRSLGHSVAFSHDYQAKITSVLDEGVVRQQALYSESPGQRIERLTHLQVNIYAACEVATKGRPWLEERIWGPSREGTVIRLPVAGGLSAFNLDTSWATWGASNRADAVKRRNRPSEESGEEGGNEGSPTKRPAPSSGDDIAPTNPDVLQRFLDGAFPRMHCVQQGEACSLSEAKAEVEAVLQPALEQYFGEGPAVDAQLQPSGSAFGRMTASTMSKYGPVLLLSAVAGGQLAIRATQIVVHTAGGRQPLEACWPKVLQDGTSSNAWRMGAPRQVGHESVRHGSRRVGSGPSTLMVQSRPRDLFLYTTEEYGEPEGDGQGLWAELNTWPVCVGRASEDAGSAELSLDRALRVQLDMLGAAQQVLYGNFDTVVLPPVAADEEQHHCFVTSDIRSADPGMAAFLPDATLTLMSFLTGEARVSGPYVDQLVQLGEERLRKGIRTCGQIEECDLAWCREAHDVYEDSSMDGDGAGSEDGTWGWIGTLTQEERDSIMGMVTQAVRYHGSLDDQARADIRAKFSFDLQYMDEAIRWVYTQRNLRDALTQGQAEVYCDKHCAGLRGAECERYCKYFVQERADAMFGDRFSRFAALRLSSSLGRVFRPREWRTLLCDDARLRAKLEEAYRLCVLDGTAPARLHAPQPYQGDLKAAMAQADWTAAKEIQEAAGVTGRQETPQPGAKPAGRPAGVSASGEALFQVGERVEYLAREGSGERWVPAEVTDIDRSTLPHGISVRLDDHAGAEERSTDLDRVRHPLAKTRPAPVSSSPAGVWSGGPPGSASPAGGRLVKGAAWIYKLDAAGRQRAVDTINRTLTERSGLPPTAQESIAAQLEYSRQELDEMLVWAVEHGAVTLSALDAKGLLRAQGSDSLRRGQGRGREIGNGPTVPAAPPGCGG